MASLLYEPWKAAVMQAGSNSSLGGTVVAYLVDAADYTVSAAHDFLDDVAAGSRVSGPITLANKTYSATGVFDADDVVFTSVTGDQSEAVILVISTGVEATSRLVAYVDSFAAVTPNGGNITVSWHASGIFKL